MTKEDAKKLVDIMVEKEDYELIINKVKLAKTYDYTKIYEYAWTIKNDEKNIWEHNFQDDYREDYSDEEITEELMKCDRYMILSTTKTIFVWQSKLENITN